MADMCHCDWEVRYPKSDTVWKSYIKATVCCYPFKGSHYIPVRKTVALCVITETPHTPSASLFLSWHYSPLIFLSTELIIVWLMGFWNSYVERVQGKTQARDDPFISSEQAVTGPNFSTKWFPWRLVVLAPSQTPPRCHRQMYGGYPTLLVAVRDSGPWEDDAYFIAKGSAVSVKTDELHCAGNW